LKEENYRDKISTLSLESLTWLLPWAGSLNSNNHLLCSAVGVGDNSVDKRRLLFLAHFKVVGSNEN
jgi:hypothetical protein